MSGTGKSMDGPVTSALLVELGVRKLDEREFDSFMRRTIRDVRSSAASVTVYEVIATGRVVIVVHNGAAPTEITLRDAVSKGCPS